MRIVLASSSPRRLELLRELGHDVEVRAPDVDETPLEGESPEALVERLARLKANSVPRRSDELVLAADTVVELDGEIMGKPTDDVDAERMLLRLAGRTHRILGGFCIVLGEAEESRVIETRVRFRNLQPREIAEYVKTGEPRDKAGAYGIQGSGGALVESVEGSYSNVVGLDTTAVIEVIRQLTA